ncbi:hypothetical protein [Streptomyces sp. NPDC047841]|uniref:hypothetical protein n=1 Tax=Streptomyces sp. NPDC047841 TaxID=3154708 RepID=UPI0034544239
MIRVSFPHVSRSATYPKQLAIWFLVPGLALFAVLVAYITYGALSDQLNAAIVAAIGVIAITFLGFAHAGPIQEITTGLEGMRVKFRGLQDQVDILRLVVRGLVTRYMLSHLRKLADLEADYVRFEWSMFRELDHLENIGYVTPSDQRGLQAIVDDHGQPGSEFHLKDYLRITSDGLEYLEAWAQVSKK